MPGCWDFFKRRRKPPERVNNYRKGGSETSTSVNQHSNAVIVVQGIAEGTQIRRDENDDERSRHSNAM